MRQAPEVHWASSAQSRPGTSRVVVVVEVAVDVVVVADMEVVVTVVVVVEVFVDVVVLAVTELVVLVVAKSAPSLAHLWQRYGQISTKVGVLQSFVPYLLYVP